MCGLFGVIGNVTHKSSVLKTLAVLNMARGEDSTGVADVFSDNEVFIRKAPLNARAFMGSIDKCHGYCTIGHTRNATIGRIAKDTAHPWRIGNIVGCHNGVVWNLWSTKKYLREVRGETVEYPVDSQYLLHTLNKYGNLGVAMGQLNVVYWNSLSKTLNFICWKNPLHLLISHDYKWGVWSSDINHLQEVMISYGLMGTIHPLKEEMFEISRKADNSLVLEVHDVPFDTKYRDEYTWASNEGMEYRRTGYWTQFDADNIDYYSRVTTANTISTRLIGNVETNNGIQIPYMKGVTCDI